MSQQTYLRAERIKKGWTQAYVGKEIGVSKVAVHDIETGKQKPSYNVLVKLENLFDKSHRYLLAQATTDTQQNSSTNDNKLVPKCYQEDSMKKQGGFRLTERAHEWVEEQARERGISKSDVIQELVNAAITLGEKELEG
jgi:transcriptional regulator with XRE-family HTH domain